MSRRWSKDDVRVLLANRHQSLSALSKLLDRSKASVCDKRRKLDGRFKRQSDEEKFKNSIVITSRGCWEWTGHKYSNGYACSRLGGRQRLVHRWSYEHYIGDIPDGLELDHLCRIRHCVNPSHLEPVTRKENARRSPHVARWSFNERCVNGHEMTEANTYIHSGGKNCRKCHNESEKRRRARLRYAL